MMQDSCLVATFAMARMTQDRGESCRSFASRLRGVARTCDFMETCPHCNHQVDCSESRVSDQLCIGVADQDIQQDLLEEITKRLTVEQVLHFVEKKTLGKKAATALKTPTTPSANALDNDNMDHVSNYKKLHKTHQPQGHTQGPTQGHTQAYGPATPYHNPTQHRPGGVLILRETRTWYLSQDGHQKGPVPCLWKDMLHLWSPQPLCPTMLADRGTGTCSGGHPPTPNLEPQLQGVDPEAVPTPTNSHSGSNHLQGSSVHGHTLRAEGSSPSTTALADTGLPELPCRYQAPQRATPGEERPDTIHPHHEVRQR